MIPGWRWHRYPQRPPTARAPARSRPAARRAGGRLQTEPRPRPGDSGSSRYSAVTSGRRECREEVRPAAVSWRRRARLGMTRIRPLACTTMRSCTPLKTTVSRSDQTMQSSDSCTNARPTTTLPLGSFGRTRVRACHVPMSSQAKAPLTTATEALRSSTPTSIEIGVTSRKNPATSPALQLARCGATSGRMRLDLGHEALRGPRKQPAVPQSAGRHQVECGSGIRLLREAGHHPGTIAERRHRARYTRTLFRVATAPRRQSPAARSGRAVINAMSAVRRNAAASPTAQSAWSDSTSASGSRRRASIVAQMSAGAVEAARGSTSTLPGEA